MQLEFLFLLAAVLSVIMGYGIGHGHGYRQATSDAKYRFRKYGKP